MPTTSCEKTKNNEEILRDGWRDDDVSRSTKPDLPRYIRSPESVSVRRDQKSGRATNGIRESKEEGFFPRRSNFCKDHRDKIEVPDPLVVEDLISDNLNNTRK